MEIAVIADLKNPVHAEAIVHLLNEYAKDEMGGGSDLPEFVKFNLISELQKRPQALVIIAFVKNEPAGLAICFEGFSSFSCMPLINVHDMVVDPKFRGRKVSTKILAKLEEIARERGCCKLTLEVLEGNKIAQNAYRSFGFGGYTLDPKMGQAMFWQKKLAPLSSDTHFTQECHEPI